MEKFMQRENGFQGHKTPRRSSEDSDFSDVFGGPPRRLSMQEMRVRYSFGESDEEIVSSQLSLLNEKPVFGEESTPRRRHPQGDGFFDDIFRGDEPFNSPRRSDRDRDSLFGSNPSSRVLSTANPLPPKAGPFSTSIPAQFSLPAKLSKASEFLTFASHNHGQQKMDVNANGSNSPRSPSRNQDEMKSEVHPAYRQSPLSHKASFSSSEDSPTLKSDQKGSIENLKKGSRNVDGLGSQFHFSFYKWAGKEAPTLLLLVDSHCMMPKNNTKYKRSVSLNERRESKSFDDVKDQGVPDTVSKSLKVECDLENEEEKKEHQLCIEEEILNDVSEPKCQTSTNDSGVYVDTIHNIKDEQANSPDIMNQQAKIAKAVHDISPDGKNVKRSEVTETVNLGATTGKNGVRGKVREFVQIFNQEADLSPKHDIRRSQSSRWKAVSTDQRDNDVSPRAEKSRGKVNLQYEDTNPDISVKVDENLNKDDGQRHSPPRKPRSFRLSRSFTYEKNTFSSDMLRRDSKIFDDAFEIDFQVQELSDEHEKITENEHSEDTKTIDAKIRQWSFGKKGNIRSLLSTLQFVLWPDSGWKPVPLADLIETNAVKRAYQKALLRLHPDKLQQKGAAFHQKYTAEKVFDILQEAWDYFNTLAPL